MAYNILWSSDAEDDLNGFLEEFRLEGKSTYIKGLIDSISNQMRLLSKMPRMFPVFNDEVRAAPLLKLPYMLFYIVNDNEKNIIEFGLLHQRQDNNKIIGRH